MRLNPEKGQATAGQAFTENQKVQNKTWKNMNMKMFQTMDPVRGCSGVCGAMNTSDWWDCISRKWWFQQHCGSLHFLWLLQKDA